MSLPHALLTALVEHPGSGFDLAERFDRSIGHFWHATHQQIYRELGRLEEMGWVESLPVPSGRGRKRSYKILASGRRELKRWIVEKTDPQPLRDELMVRLRAEAVVGPSCLDKEISRRLALHEEKLALYLKFEERDFLGRASTRELRLRHLVLKAGIQQERLWIQISREAAQILSESADST